MTDPVTSPSAGSQGVPADALPEAFLHAESGAVRFWVRTAAGDLVGAIARKEALRYHFRPSDDGADLLKLYRDHRGEIDAAVLRRVATGSREPVMLREVDFEFR